MFVSHDMITGIRIAVLELDYQVYTSEHVFDI